MENFPESTERLGADEALALLRSSHPSEVGIRADFLRRKLHSNKAYYAVNAAITYSNICEAMCPICSFARREGADGAYILSADEVFLRAQNFAKMGAEEIHIIGGIYSKLPLDYYVDICRAAKAGGGKINLVAFTVSECALMAKVSGKTLAEVFEILKDAGVDALPGGGAEVFDEKIRKKISPSKLRGCEWLDAMRVAHKCGIKTNATMLYGHIETPESVVEHLIKLRELQDETSGFKAFVPLPFRRGASKIPSKSGGVYDLKICALSRLVLDNFPHIRVPITHFGDRFAQVLLNFGADDIGGTHWSEEVAVSAGANRCERNAQVLEKTIKAAGFEPIKTNSNYAI